MKLIYSMKKAFLVSACILVVSMLSCDNDDNTGKRLTTDEDLIGTWSFTARSEGLSTGQNDFEACEIMNTVQFSENSTFIFDVFLGNDVDDCMLVTETGTWSLLDNDDNELLLTTYEESEADTLRANILDDGNTLSLIYGDSDELETFLIERYAKDEE